MKIHILRKMQYADTFIHILQFEYIFMYLFPYKGEIYMQHIIATPSLWKRFLWRIGILETPYDSDTKDQIEKSVISGAMDSLDKLREEGVKSEDMLPVKEPELIDLKT